MNILTLFFFFYFQKVLTKSVKCLTIQKNDKTKFKTALRKHLNARSCYSVDECCMGNDKL